MAGALEFVRKYGDKSFSELPFCEADNAALCGMFYMPIEKAAPTGIDDEPVSFAEVAEKMYELNGNKHVAVGLVLLKGISVEMMEMAHSRRYSEIKVVYAKEVFQEDPAVQFNAATLLLPDGKIVILFRGTDDTFTGWLEDLDIYTKKGIPSHQLAVDYINEVADKFDGDIIICGHSKGGNVALYGALYCGEKAKSRLQAIYNNDGPGFHSFDYINSREYKELLPKYKHFIPHSSFVGVLLAHDDDYTVVKSSRILGAAQHDIATWQIEGTDFIRKDDLTLLGKVTDLSLMNIILKANEEQSKAIEKVLCSVVSGTGQTCLLDFAKNAPSAIRGAVKAWKNIDTVTKDVFKDTFSGSLHIIKTAVKIAREDALPAVAKRASDLAAVLMA